MTKHTINRRSDVVTRVEGDETLVLDTVSNTAHCLTGDLAVVWNAVGTDPSRVAAATGLAIDAVEAAASVLTDLGLVAEPAGLSRRTLVTRGAMVGGAMVAAGAISIPLPAAAATTSSGTITLTNTCGDPQGRSAFYFSETGHILAGPGTSYHVLVVYTSYDGDPNTPSTLVEVGRQIEFDITTNGDGKPNVGSNTNLNTSTVSPNDDKVTGISVGTAGQKGFLAMTTGYMFAGWALPTDHPAGPGPRAALSGLEGAKQVSTSLHSGDVYLQVTPNVAGSGDPYWCGYFNNTPCFQLS